MTDAAKQEASLTKLAGAFADARQKRQDENFCSACRLFHSTLLVRLQRRLGDEALENHIKSDPDAGRYGFENRETDSALYVEIGPKSDWQNSRRISFVYRENGVELVRASTERSSIYGEVTDLAFEEGTPETMVDLLYAFGAKLSEHNGVRRLEIRDPKVEEIRALRCC